MADQDFQERTEKASSRRREKARERGQVAKSMELNSAAIITLGFITLSMLGPYFAVQMQGLVRYTMANAPMLASSDQTFFKLFVDNILRFFILIGPFLLVLTAVAFGANVAQIGFRITPKAMELKFEKLNLISGMKRLLSLKSLVTMVRDTLKLTIIGFVAYKVIASEFEGFFKLADMTVPQVAGIFGKLALELALKVGAVILIIAILDYIYQKYEFEKSIRMSRQELKDEHKETEGSPQVKSRVRQIQMQMARKRMMQAVPTADVVITNPTHLAVALKYEQSKSEAPFVVAKGQRKIAEQIKIIARENNIPVIENKPLAQALYKMCDIGQIIPADLYRAVAEILAYVYRLKGKVMN